MSKQIYFFLVIGALILTLSPISSSAQTAPTASSPATSNAPVSATSFFRGLVQKVTLLITRDPLKKAELSLQYADEKLLQLENMAGQTKVKKSDLEKQLKNYQNDFNQAQGQIKKIEAKGVVLPDKFTEKYMDQGLKQQLILQKLATQVPTDVAAKIEASRQDHLEKLGEVMAKVGQAPKIEEQILTTIKDVSAQQPGAPIRAIQVLKDLQDKAPRAVQQSIQSAETAVINGAAQDIKQLNPEQQKMFIQKELQQLANPTAAIDVTQKLEKSEPTLKPILNEIRAKPADLLPEQSRVAPVSGSGSGQSTSSATPNLSTPPAPAGNSANPAPADVASKENFCGKSSYGLCQSNSDCQVAGCSNQICQSTSEKGPIATTCEWRDCYDVKKYDLSCQCVQAKCQWTKTLPATQ